VSGVWEPFGYTADDSDRLERIAAELVDAGATDNVTTARRAIAAITWRPACDAMMRDGRTLASDLAEELRNR